MEIKSYKLGKTIVKYLINDNKNVTMLLIPAEMEGSIANPWDIPNDPYDPRARYMHQWNIGSLAYFYTDDLNMQHPGFTMKTPDLTDKTFFKSQKSIQRNDKTEIITELTCEGYTLIHTLAHIEGLRGFEVKTTFVNTKKKSTKLRMLSSFALDNISPFQTTDAPDTYKFHRFYGGWSKEGKHTVQTIEELNLEKTWSGWTCGSERFGSHGSYPVQRYFGTSAVEDSKMGVLWGARLKLNSTWQMELSRFQDTLSLTGGIGDYTYSGWEKVIKKGESFTSPTAYIATVKGDIYDLCTALNDMHKPAYLKYGEEGIPVTFNEYCTTWGKPTQEKMLSYAKALKSFDVKYLVIDAGWCKEGFEQDSNGEWIPDKNIFHDMRKMNSEIREMGMVPGIWFEFEVTTIGSDYFTKKYDNMHLKRDGRVINTSGIRTYLDFRQEKVHKHLKKKVIDLLADNGFGYIKVDYNRNLGVTVDGKESGPEELRKHLEGVRDFFKEMKKEIPDLVIENCSSGGHRLEPSMFEVSAVSSFSDAHEAIEVPYIAASLHNLMLPVHSSIWAVLRTDDTPKRLYYSLAASFLGRICLSGEIDKISDEQKAILKEALNFYKQLENVIINGDTRIYGNRSNNIRYPKGTQAVVRKTDTDAVIICHSFEETADTFSFEIPEGYNVVSKFGEDYIEVSGNVVTVNKMPDLSASVVYLKK